MTNLFRQLLGSGITPVAAERTAERFRQYRTTGNGKIEVYLPPARGDELRAKLVEASKAREVAVDEAASKREAKLREIKATYETARAAIDSEHRKTIVAADQAFDETEAKLLAEYSAPLSPQEIALLTTPAGSVVRMPSPAPAPSTALPQGA